MFTSAPQKSIVSTYLLVLSEYSKIGDNTQPASHNAISKLSLYNKFFAKFLGDSLKDCTNVVICQHIVPNKDKGNTMGIQILDIQTTSLLFK